MGAGGSKRCCWVLVARNEGLAMGAGRKGVPLARNA